MAKFKPENIISPSVLTNGNIGRIYAIKRKIDNRYDRVSNLLKTNKNNPTINRLCYDYSKLRQEFGSLLDIYKLSEYPPININNFEQHKLLKPSFRSVLFDCGFDLDKCNDDGYEKLIAINASARVNAIRSRICLEIAHAVENNWFVVFDTITYDPKRFGDNVMFGKYWVKYKNNVIKSVIRRIFGSFKKFKKSDHKSNEYVRFIAIPENHKDGRTHLHILWFMADLPDICNKFDPNYRNPKGHYRLIKPWPVWPYGQIVKRIAVRYFGDPFTSKLNWSWPCDKNGSPIKISQPIAIAHYMCKYLTKSNNYIGDARCRRIRTSPRFGVQMIIQIIEKLNTIQMISLMIPEIRTNPFHLKGIFIPKRLMNSLLSNHVMKNLLRNYVRKTMRMKSIVDILDRTLGYVQKPILTPKIGVEEMLSRIIHYGNFVDFLTGILKNMDTFNPNYVFNELEFPRNFGKPATNVRGL